MSFSQILDKYRKISFSERDKGERFERLMKSFLQTAPIYEHKFKKIWLWDEFPYTDELGGNDTGIDIIALTNENEYWAIQCKCYQETSSISKAHVDTFLSTSSRFFRIETGELIPFTHRLWISTSDNYTANAEDAFRNQQTPISRITAYDLENAAVDWDKLDQGITGTIARTAKKQLRPHQTEALTLTNTHFQTQDRGKLIMACGTGKTFTSLRIAEKETNGDGLVLFLVPSIALLGQTLN